MKNPVVVRVVCFLCSDIYMATSLSSLLGGIYTEPLGYSGKAGKFSFIGRSGYSGVSEYSGLGLVSISYEPLTSGNIFMLF